MDKFIVVVINTTQARFFTLEPAEWPEYESGPCLVEQRSLSYLSSKSRQSFWSKMTSPAPKFSDVRLKRKFAKEITSEIINLVRINQGQILILAGQPEVLNLIGEFFTPTIFDNLEIKELPHSIARLNIDEIHQLLADKKLMPAYQKVFYPG